jgi:peptide/nickel transport system permease protein
VSAIAIGRPRHRERTVARFAAQRLTRLAVVLAMLIVASFALIHLVPGDPARLTAGLNADPRAVAQARHELGLDRSLPAQLGDYVSKLAHADLGRSFATREPVTKVIGERLAPTLRLAVGSLLLVLVLSVPLGIWSAARAGARDPGERVFSLLTGALAALPPLLISTLLAFVFAVELRWLPVAGADSLSADVLPILAMSLGSAALLARLVRNEALGVLRQDYVRTARSKRLSQRRLLARHVLPNVLTAALTVGGILFASLIGGAVIVEVVFARPGLGSTLVQAVQGKDYAVVQGMTLFLGLIVVVFNALVDLLLAVVDPRMRAGAR